jgi:hypothetical protein
MDTVAVPANVEALLSWAAARGASWPLLRPSGRSFVAVDDLPAGAATPLIHVPLSLLLPVSQGARDPVFGSAFKALEAAGVEELDR